MPAGKSLCPWEAEQRSHQARGRIQETSEGSLCCMRELVESSSWATLSTRPVGQGGHLGRPPRLAVHFQALNPGKWCPQAANATSHSRAFAGRTWGSTCQGSTNCRARFSAGAPRLSWPYVEEKHEQHNEGATWPSKVSVFIQKKHMHPFIRKFIHLLIWGAFFKLPTAYWLVVTYVREATHIQYCRF